MQSVRAKRMINSSGGCLEIEGLKMKSVNSDTLVKEMDRSQLYRGTRWKLDDEIIEGTKRTGEN